MADVTLSGPLFDGTGEKILDRGIVAARHKVAADGQALASLAFLGSIRDNHDRFLRSVTVTDRARVYVSRSGRHLYALPVTAGPGETIVTSDLATYGPWLEGTGSRNVTTRFKGYHGFRKAAQELDRTAGDIASRELERYVQEMS